MTRLLLAWIVSCFVGSIGVVGVLFAVSNEMKQTPGSFLRVFPPHPVLEGDTLNIKYPSYYIAGGTTHTAYLGNYESPLHLLQVNLTSLDTQHVSLDVKGIKDQKFWSAKVRVDSPYFYLADGAVPRIYRGNTGSWTADRYSFDNTHFNEIVPINPDAYAVRTLGTYTRENVIGKIATQTPHYKDNPDLLQKQVDGLFCTSGTLSYNKMTNDLVFVYYYRNQFVVLDTALNLRYRAHTIDTNYIAKIKVATISSTGDHTMAAPPFFVNKGSCVSGQWLFVNSNILGKNQLPGYFEDAAVIDVYDLRGGVYLFSFPVYHFLGIHKMTEFRVFGDKMIVLYGRIIRIFDFKPPAYMTGSP